MKPLNTPETEPWPSAEDQPVILSAFLEDEKLRIYLGGRDLPELVTLIRSGGPNVALDVPPSWDTLFKPGHELIGIK